MKMAPMKILLVDDSRSARYALRLQLQRHGVEVDTAESAEAAFKVLEGDLPDAILMDHTMPGMNGFEALEVIRSDPRTAHIPVVMCTSHEDAEFAAAAERKGVAGILPKSVAPEKLPDILAQLRGAPAVAAAVPEPAHAPAAPAAPSAEQVNALVDARLAEEIDARLDQRIEARVTALLGDLRRDLSERLMAEARQLVESRVQGLSDEMGPRLAAALQAQESSRPTLDDTDLQTAVDRFARDALPDLVKLEVESERGQLMDLVEQYLREFAPRSNEGERITQQLAASERAAVDKALEATRREVGTALADLRGSTQPSDQITERMRSGLRGVYVGIAAAALVGVAAAVAVYLMLA